MSSIVLNGSFVHIPISPSLKTKVQIIKGNKIDTYDVLEDKERNVFPLQYGNGLYTIKVLQSINGNKYSVMLSQIINAPDTSECWLKPSQYVWYDNEVKLLSDKLNSENETNKLSAYYNYCYKTISYDYIKAFTHKKLTSYVPELNKIIKKKKGICFDKAALLCALCRINGYQCKLVIGQVNKLYHAWCQVKVDGLWRTLDPTLGKKYKIDEYHIERTC